MGTTAAILIKLSGVLSLVSVTWAASDFVLGSYELFSEPKTKSDTAKPVYLAEREGIDTVFTLDRRDFTIYRTTDGRALAIIPEP